MGLFRCDHYVEMATMQDIDLEFDHVGQFGLERGAVVKYKGFCRDCKAFVSLTEEIYSRPLYEFLERQYKATLPKKAK